MAEQMACPSCNSTLRIPAGAERIRCPRCKTEVTVAMPPVAKAIPLPPKPAIPLPFDRPTPAPKSSPVPVAKAMPVEKTVVRGKVVREEEEDDEPKKKKRRRDDDTIRNHPRFETVDKECSIARLGVRILSFGAGVSGLQTLTFALFLITVAASSTVVTTLMGLCVLLMGIHYLLFLAGFGISFFGPRGMRSTAVTGFVVTLFHGGLFVPLALFALAATAAFREADIESNPGSVLSFVFVVSSCVNNLCMLTDMPWMLYFGMLKKEVLIYVGFMVFGGLLEFAKLSSLGAMVQYYASEGKSHDIGFRSLRFVYRIIWVIIAVMILKVLVIVATIMFAMSGGDASLILFLRVPLTLLTVSYFLWWTFSWFSQFSAMNETIDVITPARYLDKRQSLDNY